MGSPAIALPVLDQSPIIFKGIARKSFCEVIGSLIGRVNFYDGEFRGVVLPEPVPFGKKVLCSVGDSLICGELKCTLVVFKDCGLHARTDTFINRQGGKKFK